MAATLLDNLLQRNEGPGFQDKPTQNHTLLFWKIKNFNTDLNASTFPHKFLCLKLLCMCDPFTDKCWFEVTFQDDVLETRKLTFTGLVFYQTLRYLGAVNTLIFHF